MGLTPEKPIKMCPSCKSPTTPENQKKIISRSSGRSTLSWRCLSCFNKRRPITK